MNEFFVTRKCDMEANKQYMSSNAFDDIEIIENIGIVLYCIEEFILPSAAVFCYCFFVKIEKKHIL